MHLVRRTDDAPEPARDARARREPRRLGLWDATAMGIGGMVGGGIFSVLGVAVTLAGNLAFGCFVLGAVLAAGTAWSYAGATARTRTALGPFDELRSRGHTELSGWLLWLLVFGYAVAMAVYAFTFGRYAAAALGWSATGARCLSVAVVVAFVAVNLRGIRVSSLTEDVVVAAKLVILAAIAVVGIVGFDVGRITPLADQGISGLLLGSATVFFAYEGFELICYDRGETADAERTIPRALLLSVAVVAAIYVGVTLGAIIATGSAINATLFSTARLIRDASAAGELPTRLGQQRGEVPLASLGFISVAGAVLAMLPGITDVIALGSGAFLAVYLLVNLLQARAADTRVERWLAGACALGCASAIVVLMVDLARHDARSLLILATFGVGVAVARLLHVRRRRR